MKNNKVLIIGLDGGTFTILNPWMDQGHLPTLRRIRDEGVWGPLRSSIPPVTVPAWSSFMTGKNPAKHGIYEFMIRKPGTYEESPISAEAREGECIWDVLGRGGKTSLVLNIPTTYPPSNINGAMIGGFLTPSGTRDFVTPDGLLEEIEKKFGPYYLYFKTAATAGFRSEKGAQLLLNECVEMAKYKFNVMNDLIDRYSPQFVAHHVWGTDRIQHEFWHLLDPDPGHPMYDAKMYEKFHDEVLGYYKFVDDLIAETWEKMGEDTSVIIMSDHGHGPIHRLIDLNTWLLREGYIKLKRTWGTRFRKLLWRCGFTLESFFNVLLRAIRFLPTIKGQTPYEALNIFKAGQKRPFMLSLNDVDWSRTRAYCKTGTGQIVINLAGREDEGIVEAGEEYEALVEEICGRLGALEDGGKQVKSTVIKRDEAYNGPYFEEMPDITYLPMDGRCLAVNLAGFTSNKVFTDNKILSGNHYLHGIFLACGEPFAAGKEAENMSIYDIAPLVLHVLDEGIPDDMDGRIHDEIYKKEFLEALPPRFVEAVQQDGRADRFMSEEDEEDIKKKLRDLGYLG